MPRLNSKQGHITSLEDLRIATALLVTILVCSRADGAVYSSFSAAISSRLDLSVAELLVYRANLTGLLSDPSAFSGTAFMPTNEAIDAFLLDQGIPSLGDLINQRPDLTRLLWYHLTEDPVNVTDLIYGGSNTNGSSYRYTYTGSGVSSLSGLPARVLSVRAARGDPRSIRIVTFDGAFANASAAAVLSVSGTSTLFVVDTVLPYWYNNIAEVLALNTSSLTPARQFVSGLVSAGLWSQMSDAAASYTVFMPTQTAADVAYSYYGSAVMDANMGDIVRYHVASGPVVLMFRTPYNLSLTSIRTNGSYTALTVTGSETGPGALADLAVAGRDTQGAVVKAFYVGGFNTRAAVYLIDRVLFPVYSTVSSFLNAPGSQYGMLAGMFRTSSYAPDIHPRDTATFLAPDDQALAAYSRDWGTLARINSSSQLLALFLRNHVVRPPVSSSALRDGMRLTTQAGEVVDVHIAGDGTVVFIGSRSSVRLRKGEQPMPILYGSSWVMPVDYVLVPSSLNLTAMAADTTGGGGGGGAGSAAAASPSPWLLAASVILAVGIAANAILLSE